MAYLLGRDVKVCVTTESDDRGVTISSGAVTLTAEGSISAGAANVLPARDVSAPLVSNAMADVTGIDITMGTVDEDIAYLGQRTALKAEIKKETTISITKKKTSNLFSDLFARGHRYGTTAASAGSFRASTEGQPTSADGFGYRVHLMLASGTEVITLAACTMASYSTTLNADGVTEETIEFMTHITPYVDGDATDGNTAATGSDPWDAEPYLF